MARVVSDHHGPFHPDPVLNRLNKDCKTHPALARLGPPNDGGRFGWYLTDYGQKRLREVDNVVHIPTNANVKHAWEAGKQQGEADAKALLENPPTPQALLRICRDASQYDMDSKVREWLARALELLSAHFEGSDPSAYYSDAKKIAGCAFVLGIHIELGKAKSDG